jgi:tetratricopeptide (TPR) repeat protein
MLAISPQHCYRERADICQRVAQYIADNHATGRVGSASEGDIFYVLLDRLMEREAFSDQNTAIRACRYLASVAPSTQHQIEALRAGATLSLHCDDEASAREAYADAQELFVRQVSSPSGASQAIGAAALALFRGLLANHRGDVDEAFASEQHAIEYLEAAKVSATTHVKAMYAEAKYNVSTLFRAQGHLEKAYDCLIEAATCLQDASLSAAPSRAHVMSSIWKLRNDLLTCSRSWYPWTTRLSGLTEAFERANAAGSLWQAIEALLFIVEHHAFAGLDDEALRVGRAAIALSGKTSDETMKLRTSINVGVRLLSTKNWRYGSTVLPIRRRLEGCNSYARDLLDYATALRAFRFGRFQEASRLAKGDGDWGPWTTLAIRRKVLAAESAHRSERDRSTTILIEDAVSAAEQLGSASVLQDAYRGALTITGDPRFKERLGEITRLLQR